MNIDNINNANNPIVPKRPVDREQNIPPAKAGQKEKSPEVEDTRGVTQVPESDEAGSAAQERDTLSISEESGLVEELTGMVEEMEETPREEAVTRARERVQNGYYNTGEFMSRLAVKLVKTERLAE